ncbi:MAG: T9SS type A sorting domain-containing protein [Bacteroidota bacterium]
MKHLITSIFVLFFILSAQILFSQALIIDHNCAKLEPIPESAILNAKSSLHIAYDHTSHGSQLITGMNGLRDLTLPNLVGYKGDIYNWNNGGTDGALDLHDDFSTVGDLGYEDLWTPATRTYLDDAANSDVNVIIWSWCDISGHDIDGYLANMETLISEYGPGGTKILDGTRTVPVTFVFMTGHTNAGSSNEWTFNANKQIRQHCIDNNRVLFDFYDIESYDPDGDYFGDGEANLLNYGTYNGLKDLEDDCSYNLDGGGRGNWAVEWRNSHTENVDWYDCYAAHSDALNGNLKAYAAWWLWAKLAGWDDGSNVALNITPDEPMNECNLDSRSLNINLSGETFIDDVLSETNFQLNGAPLTTTIESVTYTDSENANLTLAFDGTDFDANINNFCITVLGAELTGGSGLTSNELTISANDEILAIEAEVSLSETNLDEGVINISLSDESFSDDQLASGNFQLNNIPTGTTIESVVWTDATHAELNLAYDGTDFNIDFEYFSITISTIELLGCHDLTSNTLVIYSELEPTAEASVSEDLIESSLDGSNILINLDDDAFIADCSLTDKYILNNSPSGLTINSITRNSETQVNLTLAFNGTDFHSDITDFYITINESILRESMSLNTNSLTIYAENESNISDLNISNRVNIFPNPVIGIINVEYDLITNEKINIQIIDVAGKTLMQKVYGFSNKEFKTSIDINHLDKGSYYLILRQGETKIGKSIIFQ